MQVPKKKLETEKQLKHEFSSRRLMFQYTFIELVTVEIMKINIYKGYKNVIYTYDQYEFCRWFENKTVVGKNEYYIKTIYLVYVQVEKPVCTDKTERVNPQY